MLWSPLGSSVSRVPPHALKATDANKKKRLFFIMVFSPPLRTA